MEIVSLILGILIGMFITDIAITAICYKRGFRWMK